MKKTNKKPTVIVAIPAFNEEKSIVSLLKQIKQQKNEKFRLIDVWVYSDGSTDNTVNFVKTNSPRVKVKAFKNNLGKRKRINQIMSASQADILIQVDADVKLANNRVFDELVENFGKGMRVGIVCAYHKAVPSKRFVGRLAYFGFRVWDRARNSLGESGIRYYCEGGLRAFSNEFTKVFRLPIDKFVSEDSHSFYFAMQQGFEVLVAKKAIVYIDLPESYRDYIKQMKRFLSAPRIVAKSFPEDLVKKHETLSLIVKLKALVRELYESPLIGICYLALQTVTKIQMFFYKPAKNWTPIERKQA